MSRSELRGIVWRELGVLEDAGLGARKVVGDQRDKFMLRVTHPAARQLSTRPDANGFIRSDRGGLLFRDASERLRASVPAPLQRAAMASPKGLEYRWGALSPDDVRELFAVIRALALTKGSVVEVQAAAPTPPEATVQLPATDDQERARDREASSSELEARIAELTAAHQGQYPRPWMTALTDPASATVFIVGKNQAKGYPEEAVGSHRRYLDALFNRNDESCRVMYDRVTGGSPSPTRRNIDRFARLLAERGVTRVLETNVICYSTPMSADLALARHAGGRERGEEIFRELLRLIRPRVLICHGADTSRILGALLDGRGLPLPVEDGAVVSVEVNSRLFAGAVYPIPSLAPPAWGKWARWAGDYLERLADAVAAYERAKEERPER